MLDVVVERGGLESLLPHLRQIAETTLANRGFVLRSGVQLAYKPRIDETPERITIEIHSPVVAVIVGKWTEKGCVRFTVTDFNCSFAANAEWPFLTQAEQSGVLQIQSQNLQQIQEHGRELRSIFTG